MLKRHWPTVRLALIVIVLVFMTWNGLDDGLSAAKLATTPGVRVAAVLQLLSGVAAAGALFAIVMEPPRVFSILVFWGIVFVATASIAPTVVGGAPFIAAIAAGGSTAAVVALVLWGWRAHLASEKDSPS